MEIRCYSTLSKEQLGNLPGDYVFPSIEGTYIVDGKHSEGVVLVYVGYCDWENRFEKCLKDFILTIFHKIMHILFPELGDGVRYAEKILAEILDN